MVSGMKLNDIIVARDEQRSKTVCKPNVYLVIQ